MWKMKCPNCEKEIQDKEVIYCPQCGLNLKEGVIEKEAEEVEREKRTKVMKKLSKADEEDLLSRGIPKEKIPLIREDLKLEFLEGNLERLPILLKDCVFQEYSKNLGREDPRKGILCVLMEGEKRCMKEICPLYQLWKKG